MYNWFECKIKYDKTLENGLQKKVVEPYVVDALSFTEAERRVTEELEPLIRGGFVVDDIRRLRIAELIDSERLEDDRWFKVKISIIIIDEKSAKEKRVSQTLLVRAINVKSAIDHVEESMKNSMQDYLISGVTETAIMDVFPYKAE